MTTYEELGKMKSNGSCYPSTCFSYAESALYVAEAVDTEFNKICKEIGVAELQLFESGSECIYEADDESKFSFKKNVIDPIIKALQKFWAWVKKKYEDIKFSISIKIKETEDKIYNKLKLSKDFLSKNADAIKAAEKKGRLGKIHTYEGLTDKCYKDLADKAERLCKKYVRYIDNQTSVADISNYKKAFESEICSELAGDDKAKNVADMNKALAKKYKDDTEVDFTYAYLKNHYKQSKENIDNVLKNGYLGLAEAYIEEKKAFNEAISNARKIKIEEQNIAAALAWFDLTKLKMQHASTMKLIDIEKSRFIEYSMKIAKIALIICPRAEKKVASESVEISEDEISASVSEAFAW